MSPETLIFMPNGDVTIVLIRHVTRETTETYRTSSNLSNSPELGKSTSSPDQTSIDEDEQPEDNSVAEVEELADLEDNVLYFAPDPPENLNGPLYQEQHADLMHLPGAIALKVHPLRFGPH